MVTQGSGGPGAGDLLRVEGLRTHFFTPAGVIRAVDGVSFAIGHGERLGLVGESGSGKSVTALSILRLVREPGRIVSGRISFCGEDLLARPEKAMRRIRGGRIAMIFQDPANYLDPMFTAGDAIAEAITLHAAASRREARRQAVALLRELKVPSPEDVMDAYPFQLSGGMCQRVLIAMAIATRPELLIADEPTSGLDVTVQASILRTLRQLTEESGTAMLLTTHSMPVVRKACARTIVMYCGRIVEAAPTEQLLARPLHPYTQALLRSMPALEQRGRPLASIPGEPPRPGRVPPGCAFAPRCPIARPDCAERQPPLLELEPGRLSACPYLRAHDAGRAA
jgi:oligopeptide/dipeptide ABC transporter ATP-binding protein